MLSMEKAADWAVAERYCGGRARRDLGLCTCASSGRDGAAAGGFAPDAIRHSGPECRIASGAKPPAAAPSLPELAHVHKPRSRRARPPQYRSATAQSAAFSIESI